MRLTPQPMSQKKRANKKNKQTNEAANYFTTKNVKSKLRQHLVKQNNGRGLTNEFWGLKGVGEWIGG